MSALALDVVPFPLLRLADLEHDLHAHKEGRAGEQDEQGACIPSLAIIQSAQPLEAKIKDRKSEYEGEKEKREKTHPGNP